MRKSTSAPFSQLGVTGQNCLNFRGLNHNDRINEGQVPSNGLSGKQDRSSRDGCGNGAAAVAQAGKGYDAAVKVELTTALAKLMTNHHQGKQPQIVEQHKDFTGVEIAVQGDDDGSVGTNVSDVTWMTYTAETMREEMAKKMQELMEQKEKHLDQELAAEGSILKKVDSAESDAEPQEQNKDPGNGVSGELEVDFPLRPIPEIKDDAEEKSNPSDGMLEAKVSGGSMDVISSTFAKQDEKDDNSVGNKPREGTGHFIDSMIDSVVELKLELAQKQEKMDVISSKHRETSLRNEHLQRKLDASEEKNKQAQDKISALEQEKSQLINEVQLLRKALLTRERIEDSSGDTAATSSMTDTTVTNDSLKNQNLMFQKVQGVDSFYPAQKRKEKRRHSQGSTNRNLAPLSAATEDKEEAEEILVHRPFQGSKTSNHLSHNNLKAFSSTKNTANTSNRCSGGKHSTTTTSSDPSLCSRKKVSSQCNTSTSGLASFASAPLISLLAGRGVARTSNQESSKAHSKVEYRRRKSEEMGNSHCIESWNDGHRRRNSEFHVDWGDGNHGEKEESY